MNSSKTQVSVTEVNSLPARPSSHPPRQSIRYVLPARQGYNGRRKCQMVQFSTATLKSSGKPNTDRLRKHHLAYKFVRTECKLVRSILHAFGFSECHPGSSAFNFMWTGGHVKPFEFKALEPHQKTNHFPRSFELTRKDRLYKNIQTMQQTKGKRHFDFIPTNFILPSEMDAFYSEFAKQRGFWIVKPVASSRGRGIYLINHPKQVSSNDQVLVCKYIESPLLVDGFKFDCRIYVVATSFDPLTIYVYEEGLARFSTIRYKNTAGNIKNLCMHLTNYSINKVNKDYVRCDNPDVEDYGNKWSFSALLQYLQKIGKDTSTLMSRIEDIIVKTFLAGESSIASACNLFVGNRGNCFELFGFDILIDENMKPWLLEVNLSPSLACDAPMDFKIKSNLMVDLFNLSGFIIQDPLDKKMHKIGAVSASLGRHTRSSSASARQTTSSCDQLEYSSEEKQMLRETRQEYQNRGRFVRVYPTPESWRQYGHLHTHYTTKNKTLHAMLFPELWELTRLPSSNSDSRRFPRSSSRNNNLVFGNNKVVSHSRNGLNFQQRYLCYMRKLLEEKSPAVPRNTINPDTSDAIDAAIDKSATAQMPRQQPQQSISKGYEAGLLHSNNDATSLTQEECQQCVVNSSMYLTPYQARMTFSTYLERVQHRLLQQCSPQSKIRLSNDEVDKHTKQIELVLHFLHRASVNLKTPMRIASYPEDMTLQEKRRVLARQLRDFLRCYSAETETGYAAGNKPTSMISPHQFQVFIGSASESTLETVLTSFIKNKNMSAVFFGEKKEDYVACSVDDESVCQRSSAKERRQTQCRSATTSSSRGSIGRRPVSAVESTRDKETDVLNNAKAQGITPSMHQMPPGRTPACHETLSLFGKDTQHHSLCTSSGRLRGKVNNLMSADNTFESLVSNDSYREKTSMRPNFLRQSVTTQTGQWNREITLESTMCPRPPDKTSLQRGNARWHFYKQRIGHK